MHGEDSELVISGGRSEFERMRLASAKWAEPIDFSNRHTFEEGDFWLGRSPVTGEAIGNHDDRHVFLCSGSRSGKGTSVIINNLCSWKGSAIVLDPKGENASVTAARRSSGSEYCEGIGQDVHVLDPFCEAQVNEELRSRYNPLDSVDMSGIRFNDETMRIVNSIILKSEGRSSDRFFDLTAQDMLRGVILHVKSHPDYEGRRNLSTVRQLLSRGEYENVKLLMEHRPEMEAPNPLDLLWQSMSLNEAGNGIIAGIGQRILSARRQAPETYQGVYQNCLTETMFLDSPAIQQVTEDSDFALSDLKTSENGTTVYLCLSLDDMDTYFKWLRVMITLSVSAMIKTKGRPATGHQVLMCLDEFACLKRMKIIEDAVAQLAGYGLKMFFAVQNLGQLKELYKDNWETFLGNSGVKLFFGLNDHYFTMKYVSDLIGETEVSRETYTSSETDSSSESESRGTSKSVAEGQTRSIARGETQSDTEGYNRSKTDGKSSSISKSTNTSDSRSVSSGQSRNFQDSHSSNWGKSTGTNENSGGNHGQSWGQGRNSGFSLQGGSSWGGSSMFQNSSGQSWGRGTSKGENWGEGTSHSAGGGKNWGKSRSQTRGSGYSETHGQSSSSTEGYSRSHTSGESITETEGESITRTDGESHQTTRGSGQSKTRGLNQGLHHRSLLSPNEANLWFAPIVDRDSNHYPGYCLILISGEHPTAVRKAQYFEDNYFTGWFDAHPDHPENSPPVFSVEVPVETGLELVPDKGYTVEALVDMQAESEVEAGDTLAYIGQFSYKVSRAYKGFYDDLILEMSEYSAEAEMFVAGSRLHYKWPVYAPVDGVYVIDNTSISCLGKIRTNTRVLTLSSNETIDLSDQENQVGFQVENFHYQLERQGNELLAKKKEEREAERERQRLALEEEERRKDEAEKERIEAEQEIERRRKEHEEKEVRKQAMKEEVYARNHQNYREGALFLFKGIVFLSAIIISVNHVFIEPSLKMESRGILMKIFLCWLHLFPATFMSMIGWFMWLAPIWFPISFFLKKRADRIWEKLEKADNF